VQHRTGDNQQHEVFLLARVIQLLRDSHRLVDESAVATRRVSVDSEPLKLSYVRGKEGGSVQTNMRHRRSVELPELSCKTPKRHARRSASGSRPGPLQRASAYLQHALRARNFWVRRVQIQGETVIHVVRSRRDPSKAVHGELLVRVVLLQDGNCRGNGVLVLVRSTRVKVVKAGGTNTASMSNHNCRATKDGCRVPAWVVRWAVGRRVVDTDDQVHLQAAAHYAQTKTRSQNRQDSQYVVRTIQQRLQGTTHNSR
jgi:hypothetical protein